jgi:hypothetical protein
LKFLEEDATLWSIAGALTPRSMEGAGENSQLAVRGALRDFGVWKALTVFAVWVALAGAAIYHLQRRTTISQYGVFWQEQIIRSVEGAGGCSHEVYGGL